MTELLAQSVTAFSLGLLGSGHCLAMCGGIMGALSMRAAAAAGGAGGTVDRGVVFGQLLLYSSGRLLSYAALGALLGLLGAVLVTALAPAGALLRALAGGLLIAMGLYLAGVWRGILLLERAGGRLWQRFGLASSGGNNALLLGLGWGLLPCGLVYGTLAWAASSAEPLRSGWLMLAFGLGTLPAVLAGGYFSTELLAGLRRPGLRMAAGMLVVGFGIWTLLSGTGLHVRDAGHDHAAAGHGHAHTDLRVTH